MSEKEVAIREPETKSIAEVKSHTNLVHQVLKDIMKKGEHYDKIPGCGDKMVLLKSGAEKIGLTFRIALDPIIEDLSSKDEIRYRIICRGNHQVTGYFLGAGVGECSSNEEKFKWRKAVCKEEWDDTPDDRRRMKWKKPYQKPAYKIMQVRENPADVANTVLKIAKKRGAVDMVLTITAASDIFTQDIEENPEKYQKDNGQSDTPSQSIFNLDDKLGFGKHKELTWGTVPLEYLDWLIKNTEGQKNANAKQALELLKKGESPEPPKATTKPVKPTPTYTVRPKDNTADVYDVHKEAGKDSADYTVDMSPDNRWCSCPANPNKGECKHFSKVEAFIKRQTGVNPAPKPQKEAGPAPVSPSSPNGANTADIPAPPDKINLIAAYVSQKVIGMQIAEAKETLPEGLLMSQAVSLLNYLCKLQGEIECPEWLNQIAKIVGE